LRLARIAEDVGRVMIDRYDHAAWLSLPRRGRFWVFAQVNISSRCMGNAESYANSRLGVCTRAHG
jgi:hypothetical protein